jgi:hypothetical protein
VVNRAAEGSPSTAVDQPPSSREEAILQAKTALQSAVGKFVAKQGRRKGGIASQLRVQVEVSWGLKQFMPEFAFVQMAWVFSNKKATASF